MIPAEESMSKYKITRTIFGCTAVLFCAASAITFTVCTSGKNSAAVPVYTAFSTETTPYPDGGADTLTELEEIRLLRGAKNGTGTWTYTLDYAYKTDYENGESALVKAVLTANGDYARVITNEESDPLVSDGDGSDFDTVIIGTVSRTRLTSLKTVTQGGNKAKKKETLDEILFESEKDFKRELLRDMEGSKNQTVYFYINTADNALIGFDIQSES